MGTIVLKDRADANVTLSLAGADSRSARYTALALNTPTMVVDLAVSQQRTQLGSKASHRATVKVSHEILTTVNGAASVSKSSISALATIPPGTTLTQFQDEAAMIVAYFSDAARVENLYNGIMV